MIIMATATFDRALVGTAATKEGAEPRKSLWGMFVAAREKEAQRRVADYMSIYSDEHLASWGLSARDIEILRRGGYSSIDFAG
jgi:hypothetical protein